METRLAMAAAGRYDGSEAKVWEAWAGPVVRAWLSAGVRETAALLSAGREGGREGGGVLAGLIGGGGGWDGGGCC